MYDMDNDGVISKDELMAFLTLMVGSNVSQDQVTMLKIFFIKISLQNLINWSNSKNLKTSKNIFCYCEESCVDIDILSCVRLAKFHNKKIRLLEVI
jgi:hypothetical protein